MGFGDAQKNYIKTETLKTGDEVKFLDGGKWEVVDFSPTKDGSKKKNTFQITVSVNGAEGKTLSINATSGKVLAEAWGSEEEGAWAGKTAIVTFAKMLSFGEMKNVLCLEPKK
jgi:hypothetical protein